jgi:hypothetical protein
MKVECAPPRDARYCASSTSTTFQLHSWTRTLVFFVFFSPNHASLLNFDSGMFRKRERIRTRHWRTPCAVSVSGATANIFSEKLGSRAHPGEETDTIDCNRPIGRREGCRVASESRCGGKGDRAVEEKCWTTRCFVPTEIAREVYFASCLYINHNLSPSPSPSFSLWKLSLLRTRRRSISGNSTDRAAVGV